MRMKTYTAPTMSEALDQLRRELGEDALLVSTQRLGAGAGVRVTAAVEEDDIETEIERLSSRNNNTAEESPFFGKIRNILTGHDTPVELVEKILLQLKEPQRGGELAALAKALDTVFVFHHLPEHVKGQSFMLIGAPGVGKTVITGKLATRACMSGRRVGIVCADTVRAGAAEQLVAFTNILDISLIKAHSPDSLRKHIRALEKTCDLIYVDMPALNPFKPQDMDFLSAYIETAGALPVLVMPAGIDPYESQETAEAFAEAGAAYLLATRLDAARRFGGILAAADAGKLTVCEASLSPSVSRGLSPVNAVSLAKLLLTSSEESDNEPRTRS